MGTGIIIIIKKGSNKNEIAIGTNTTTATTTTTTRYHYYTSRWRIEYTEGWKSPTFILIANVICVVKTMVPCIGNAHEEEGN